MLTPADKLRSGANDIIQIVVTTACDLYTCSNCTQLLPFRRDYRHMDMGCFIRALETLQGWPGVVSLFGGNPCSHPQFPFLCRILAHFFPDQRQRGLWSNNLLQHGEVAREVFYPDGRFNLNAHGNAKAAEEMEKWLPHRLIPSSQEGGSVHSSILLNYRDFGISETAWIEAREACDINQRWSAAIVERDGRPYAYFCEVAAALDGMRGHNHGIPVYYEWWKAPMAAYAHQVWGCCDHGCGVPLRAQGHGDDAALYDVSESFVPLASLTRSTNKVRLVAHTERPPTIPEVTDYMKVRS